MDLKEGIADLYGGRITSYNFDLILKRIQFTIVIIENGDVKRYEVEFRDVSCFYFLNNTTESRLQIYEFNEEEGDFLEFTDIHTIQSIVIRIGSEIEKLLSEQYIGGGNIAIDMWGEFLIIEASQIRVNNDIFDL